MARKPWQTWYKYKKKGYAKTRPKQTVEATGGMGESKKFRVWLQEQIKKGNTNFDSHRSLIAEFRGKPVPYPPPAGLTQLIPGDEFTFGEHTKTQKLRRFLENKIKDAKGKPVVFKTLLDIGKKAESELTEGEIQKIKAEFGNKIVTTREVEGTLADNFRKHLRGLIKPLEKGEIIEINTSEEARKAKIKIGTGTTSRIMAEPEFKQIKVSKEEIIPKLRKFQRYLAAKIGKFPTTEVATKNLNELVKGSGENPGQFQARVNQLRAFYKDPESRPGLVVNKRLSGRIRFLPYTGQVEATLASEGYKPTSVKAIRDVRRAHSLMLESHSEFEHALPQQTVRGFGFPRKYYVAGQRHTNWLNSFKIKFDSQIHHAANRFANGTIDPKTGKPYFKDYAAYRRFIDKLRETVSKRTGGAKMGFVDFIDGDPSRPTPSTPYETALRGQGNLGRRNLGFKMAMDNIAHHRELYRQYQADPKNADFGTLDSAVTREKIRGIKGIPFTMEEGAWKD